MLAIEVNFLTGRFVATAHNDRETSEWPPHPARLFSALVAGWAEAGEDDAEREALQWLEGQPPPALAASAADPRKVVSFFVPVNDASIIGGAWYERRSQSLDNLEDQFVAELEQAGGELTKKVERIRDKIQNALDVDDQVSKTGTTAVKSALELLPDGRGKQERHFPSVTPTEPRVTFVWANAEPSGPIRNSLDDLVGRVTRLGHSSSLVSCRMVDDAPSPNWNPGPGSHVLRCTGPGQLAALRDGFQQHQAVKPRALPFSAVRYREGPGKPDAVPPLRPDTAGDWFVFEFLLRSRASESPAGGARERKLLARPPATRTAEVAATMRAAIMSHAEDPIPEGLSGHQSAGTPTLEPHVAFLPLPYVGSQYADGRLMGLAVSMPASLDDVSRKATLRAIGHWEQEEPDSLSLTFGSGGILRLQRKVGPIDLVSIRPELWQRPSKYWVSATPIALPTHPGPLSKGSTVARAKAWDRAEHGVAASCRHVGIPEPVQVVVSLDPFISGARSAPEYPTFRQRGRDRKPVARRLIHAALTFDQPVQGPLVLGAGRFLGLGLMRPVSDPAMAEGEADADE